MKQIVHCLLAALLLLPALNRTAIAQTTVTIGSGSETDNTFPITYNFNYSYTQTIYTAEELVGAGGMHHITKIRYKANTEVATFPWKNWVIYLGNTSKEGFTSSADWIPVSSMTKVFDGTIPASTAAGAWMEIALDTSFEWDGTSNLVVAVDQNTNDWGNNPNWAAYTLAPGDASLMKGVFYRSPYPHEPGPDPTEPDPVPDPENYNPDPENPDNLPNTVTNRSNRVAQIQFEIQAEPLPVVLTQITARNEGRRNRIEWHSGKEANVSHYEIEKSRDGRSFTYLGKAAARNQSFGYNFYDEVPFEGLSYYRLKMVDKDGSLAYSKVVSALMDAKAGFTMSAAPNPATAEMTIAVKGAAAGARVQVMDLSSRVLLEQSLKAGKATFNMQSLPPGIYLVRYADGQRVETMKIEKQ